LTQTYITLSVTDIVDKAGFTGSQANAEVEKSILEMVGVHGYHTSGQVHW
jgi:hypothetical protein